MRRLQLRVVAGSSNSAALRNTHLQLMKLNGPAILRSTSKKEGLISMPLIPRPTARLREMIEMMRVGAEPHCVGA